MSLRRKIADNPRINRAAETALAGWIGGVWRSSTWQRAGFEPMQQALRAGDPVIVVLWHQRLLMAPYLFDRDLGRLCTLTAAARAGRMGGRIVARFGADTIAMSSNRRHIALSRAVLGRIRDGWSIGLAADGPRGPARVASGVAVTWARATGCRVFAVAFSARRVVELPTWDRMWLPLPWTRGAMICREWVHTMPRQPTADQAEALRRSLGATLDAVTDAADRAAGRRPQQHS